MSMMNSVQIMWFCLFSLFCSSLTLDNIWQKPSETEQPITRTLRKLVNRLRRYEKKNFLFLVLSN